MLLQTKVDGLPGIDQSAVIESRDFEPDKWLENILSRRSAVSESSTIPTRRVTGLGLEPSFDLRHQRVIQIGSISEGQIPRGLDQSRNA